MTHTLPPPEHELPHTLHDDRHRLEEADVPIVTISATFKKEIEKNLGEKAQFGKDVVFSRAHYSMAIAVFSAANFLGLSAWLVDPINYIPLSKWARINFLERVGKTAARINIVKLVKNFFEKFSKSRVVFANIIREPLLYATERTEKPIISLHNETGNILAATGKKVIQVVTDPFVRPQYLFEANSQNIVFAVFDEDTKKELLQKAKLVGKTIDSKRVIVTGPPVDPRIVGCRKSKNHLAIKKRRLRLMITTGGLGTNKSEIKTLLLDLLPQLDKLKVDLILYAGTQYDFRQMFYDLPRKFDVSVGDIKSKATVRVIYDESIVQANQELVEYGFSWADGVVTKPSGDMAYDGAVSGSFLLFLRPWGVWEESAKDRFVKMGIGQDVLPKHFTSQLEKLKTSGWMESAIKKAITLPSLYQTGAENIVKLQQTLSKEA